jgi:predicted nucleic acid-binding protein
MPASDNTTSAVDTSVAIAALDESHEAHTACRTVARARRPALAGHASFEVFSVLTRLPGGSRLTPEVVGDVLNRAFPTRCWLTPKQQEALFRRLPNLGVTGGMVYDALVAEAARVAGRVLLTRDRRAQRTYEEVGVRTEFVG